VSAEGWGVAKDRGAKEHIYIYRGPLNVSPFKVGTIYRGPSCAHGLLLSTTTSAC